MSNFNHYPEIILVGQHDHEDKNFDVKYRNSDFHSIHVYGYPCQLRIDDQEIEIEKGDVSFIPMDITYSYHLPEKGKHWVIHYRSIRDVKIPVCDAPPVVVKPQVLQEAVLRKVFEIFRQWRHSHSSPLALHFSQALVHEFRLWLLQQHEKSLNGGEEVQQKVELVAEAIEQQLNRSIDLRELCEIAQMSQNYLGKIFKEHYGMSMSAYHMSRRMELAQYLLLSSSLSIGVIGRRIGMSSPQYFNKKFRVFTGRSPSEMRKNG
jgi:AraC-like DNA-binding protein